MPLDVLVFLPETNLGGKYLLPNSDCGVPVAPVNELDKGCGAPSRLILPVLGTEAANLRWREPSNLVAVCGLGVYSRTEQFRRIPCLAGDLGHLNVPYFRLADSPGNQTCGPHLARSVANPYVPDVGVVTKR